MKSNRRDNKNRVLKEGEYQKSNGSYEYRYTCKNGKRKSIYAPTLKGLREKERTLLRNSLNGIDVSCDSLRVDDLFEKWLRLKKNIKDNTKANYEYMYRQYVEGGFGRCKVTDVHKSDVREFYNTLYEERNLKPSTIDSIHIVLHQVFQIAVDDEMILVNPADSALKELKSAHGDDSEKRMSLTEQQEIKVLRFVKSSAIYHHWFPLLIVLFFTGLRIGELAGLTWSDIDLEADIIHVRHTLVYYSKRSEKSQHGGCVYRMNTPKTHAGYRDIPILPIVHDAILAEKANLEKIGIKSAIIVDGYSDFVFLNKEGLPLHNGIVNKAIRRIVRDCNYSILDSNQRCDECIPNFSCHSCRHTAATRMNEVGMNDKARKDILGHESEDITNKVYTDTFIEFRASEMAKLNPLADKILS